MSEEGVSNTVGALVLAAITVTIALTVVGMGFVAGHVAPEAAPAMAFAQAGGGAAVAQAETGLVWSDFRIVDCPAPLLNGFPFPSDDVPVQGGDLVTCPGVSGWSIAVKPGILVYRA